MPHGSIESINDANPLRKSIPSEVIRRQRAPEPREPVVEDGARGRRATTGGAPVPGGDRWIVAAVDLRGGHRS
ncbi:unnamed protein product [Prorocentrum cordatum]|uniref:Uncharacterized protein n=1 Tax=Prorocentrum cordatum TaxID=2364126 RepID=A0ABN9UDR4_9DINO|nr:unnamed protein product [Polarella glacialis]